MPFGLHGAPATFQRLMDQVLVGLEGNAAASLDDVVIFSSSWEENLEHLKEVVSVLNQLALLSIPVNVP